MKAIVVGIHDDQRSSQNRRGEDQYGMRREGGEGGKKGGKRKHEVKLKGAGGYTRGGRLLFRRRRGGRGEEN
jgi:hypothetical protein